MLAFIILVLIAFVLYLINSSLDDEQGVFGPNSHQHSVYSNAYQPSSEYRRSIYQDRMTSNPSSEDSEDYHYSRMIASMTGSVAAGYAAGGCISGAMMGARHYDLMNDFNALDLNESSGFSDPFDDAFYHSDFDSSFDSCSGFDHGSSMWD